MKLTDFDFLLPEELIAKHPLSKRDSAKMLVVDDKLQNYSVKDLPQFLKENDVLVFNDSKVIPARLIGKVGEAKVEVTLHKNLGEGKWMCFAKPGKKLKVGGRFEVADDFAAYVESKEEDGQVTLKFLADKFWEKLDKNGSMPLPPYMKRQADEKDKTTYQTVYADKEGSIAAPTAGLHFTKELLEEIRRKKVKICFVTLHVGAGTFLPVKTESILEHKMHSEAFSVKQETADIINSVKKNGGRLIAVGTTTLRVLESIADENGKIKAGEDETNIFIYPGYKFKTADILMTNFHLPKSTLFMLVSAFAGQEKMKLAYKHAIDNKYRFFSYGDASLLFRDGK